MVTEMPVSTLQLLAISLLTLTFLSSVSCQFGVGISDPVPTFVTSDYVIVDRTVTLFCMKACGGECETCCAYSPDRPDYYQTIGYMEICHGRLGKERAICLELLSNLEFICTKASYKYKTDSPVQEFKLEKVFNNQKRGIEQLTSKPALGISTKNPIPLSISKRNINADNVYSEPVAEYYDSNANDGNYKDDKYDDQYNDKYDDKPSYNDNDKVYKDKDTDSSFDYNYYYGPSSKDIPYQEVFVCANKLGATHYRPVNPSYTNSTSSNTSVPTAFWDVKSPSSSKNNDKHSHEDHHEKHESHGMPHWEGHRGYGTPKFYPKSGHGLVEPNYYRNIHSSEYKQVFGGHRRRY